MGEKDAGGQVIFAPFNGNNPPPGNDYAGYVVQDTYANPYMFFFNPETDPVQYWVRKGYQVFLTQEGEELLRIAERGQGADAFFSGYRYGSQFINNHVERFIPSGRGVYDVFGWGWPPYEVPAARGILYSSDSNLVQGTGAPGPLDLVYDCGSDNTIINMTALACPVSI